MCGFVGRSWWSNSNRNAARSLSTPLVLTVSVGDKTSSFTLHERRAAGEMTVQEVLYTIVLGCHHFNVEWAALMVVFGGVEEVLINHRYFYRIFYISHY